MSIVAGSPAFMTVAKSNQALFSDTASNDLLLGVHNLGQRILLGVSNNPSVVEISSSNVNVTSSMQVQMMTVGGQMIGTGTNVVFSPIASGFTADNTSGVGIGSESVQTTTVTPDPNHWFIATTNVLFSYLNISGNEQSFASGAVAFTGKYASVDYVLVNDNVSLVLTGSGGVFCFGFDSVTDESAVFRCYYNKSTATNAPQDYYLLRGSAFATAMLPTFTTLFLQYNTSDNGGKTFTSCPVSTFRITRLSVA